jgi:hypothetical protein
MPKTLRIAVTAPCLTACLLLVVLWVQGYWRTQSIKLRKPPLGCSVWSGRGAIAVSFSNHIRVNESDRFVYETYPIGRDRTTLLGFDYQPGSSISWTIFIPNWFTIGLIGVLGAISWIPWRFSLRTLLVVTTLVAVGLGVVVSAL